MTGEVTYARATEIATKAVHATMMVSKLRAMAEASLRVLDDDTISEDRRIACVRELLKDAVK
jgi:hypothetical protein